MESLDLLPVRILVSVIGIVGNSLLMVSLLHSARLKPFEIFLLGLSVCNLEEIAAVDVYDVLLSRSKACVFSRACRGLKFLTLFGEIGSILFTVLISVYRWQKLRMRVGQPLVMDGPGPARALAVSCAALALLFASPTLLINLDWTHSNSSSPACLVDFFQCSLSRCPVRNRVYKYSFLVLCNLLPLLLVTLSGAAIVRVLVLHTVNTKRDLNVQQRAGSGFQRSTIAILTAMALFQLNWSVYLALHLACDPYTLPAWSELELLITSCYSSISPYVYGIGNNLFSRRRFTR
ncbi:uncharacterized protein ora6 [Siphateles boraxobius]|uniref:uncharacterized protein ora6 n=1 Tax=Siphateles boraxobius TaxID=180520 RepID=UPI0040638D81